MRGGVRVAMTEGEVLAVEVDEEVGEGYHGDQDDSGEEDDEGEVWLVGGALLDIHKGLRCAGGSAG